MASAAAGPTLVVGSTYLVRYRAEPTTYLERLVVELLEPPKAVVFTPDGDMYPMVMSSPPLMTMFEFTNRDVPPHVERKDWYVFGDGSVSARVLEFGSVKKLTAQGKVIGDAERAAGRGATPLATGTAAHGLPTRPLLRLHKKSPPPDAGSSVAPVADSGGGKKVASKVASVTVLSLRTWLSSCGWLPKSTQSSFWCLRLSRLKMQSRLGRGGFQSCEVVQSSCLSGSL